jgi:hypothetical protein
MLQARTCVQHIPIKNGKEGGKKEEEGEKERGREKSAIIGSRLFARFVYYSS